MNSIICKDLNKSFQDFTLANINFEIEQAGIVGLVGENGAGKSTLINLILNKIDRDSGSITIFGEDMKANECGIKNKIGVVLDESHFPENQSMIEIESFMKCIYANWDYQKFTQYAKEFELPMKKPIKTFSRGMKRKLDLTVALSHNAQLLILDELTSGIDFMSTDQVINILRNYNKNGGTILFSSHNLLDVERLSKNVLVLKKGKILLNCDKNKLLKNHIIIRCSKEGSLDVDKNYIIKKYEDGNDYFLLLNKKQADVQQDAHMLIEKTTLEQIVKFYYKGE